MPGQTTRDRLRPRWETRKLLGMAWLSLPLGISVTLTVLMVNIPRYFVDHFAGERALGIFGALDYVGFVGMTVIMAVGESAMPRLARYHSAGQTAAFGALLAKLAAVGAAIGAAGVAVALVAGRPMLAILYGPAYAAHSSVLVWTMTAAALGYVAAMAGYGVMAARYFRIQIPLLLLAAAVTAAACWWLVPRRADRCGGGPVPDGHNSTFRSGFDHRPRDACAGRQVARMEGGPVMIAGKRHSPWLLSCLLCGLLLLGFGVGEAIEGSGRCLHWFLVPLTLCGILIGVDAVRWCTGEVETFDPVGLIGLFGVYFFFVAPLLHVRWDHWIDEVTPPPDWRFWLGAMAALNVVGLLAYRAALAYVEAGTLRMTRATTAWHLRPRRLRWALAVALPLAVALQVWVYARYGGLTGYMIATEHREQAFLGNNRIGTISASFPVLVLFAYAVLVAARRKTPTWATLYLVLLAFGALKLLFGGLQGSRAEIVWAVFAAVGLVHYWVRPLSRATVVTGAIALVLFMYLYGFYKSAGVDGLQKALEVVGRARR